MKCILLSLILSGSLAHAHGVSYSCKISDLTSGVQSALWVTDRLSASLVTSSGEYRIVAELLEGNIQVIVRDRSNSIVAASAAPEETSRLMAYAKGAANVECHLQ